MWYDSKTEGRPRPKSHNGKYFSFMHLQFFCRVFIDSIEWLGFSAFLFLKIKSRFLHLLLYDNLNWICLCILILKKFVKKNKNMWGHHSVMLFHSFSVQILLSTVRRNQFWPAMVECCACRWKAVGTELRLPKEPA